jgi:hypothetical protein
LPPSNSGRNAHHQQKAQRVQRAQHQHGLHALLTGAKGGDQDGRHGELAALASWVAAIRPRVAAGSRRQRQGAAHHGTMRGE